MYHLISSSTNLYWPSTSQYRHILTQYHQVPLIIHHLMSHAQYTWSSFQLQSKGYCRFCHSRLLLYISMYVVRPSPDHPDHLDWSKEYQEGRGKIRFVYLICFDSTCLFIFLVPSPFIILPCQSVFPCFEFCSNWWISLSSACNPEFWIRDFALASCYKGEIWDLCTKLGLFWDYHC